MISKYNMVRGNLKGDIKIAAIIEQLKLLEADSLSAKKKIKDKVTRVNNLINLADIKLKDIKNKMGTMSDQEERTTALLDIGKLESKIKTYNENKQKLLPPLNEVSLGAADIRRDIQRITYLSVIDKVLGLKFPIYTAHFYDFRGRMYPKSIVSFMYFKAIRAFFKTSFNKPNYDEIRKSKYFERVMSQRVFLGENLESINPNDIDRYFLNIILLELGKLQKKSILGVGLELRDFIAKGIELFYSDCSNVDIDDFGYLYKLKHCLNTFIATRNWVDITIIRDSTASSFQH
jgi:hypothetical protein